jgi:hypothetical protein
MNSEQCRRTNKAMLQPINGLIAQGCTIIKRDPITVKRGLQVYEVRGRVLVMAAK